MTRLIDSPPQGTLASRQSAPSHRPGELTLDVLQASRRDLALQEWTTLEARAGHVPIMASAAWVDAWLNHYADLVPHFFVRGAADGACRAMCLVTRGVGQQEGGIPLRTLHLGTSGEPEDESVCVEYNGWPAEEDYRQRFARQLFALLAQDPGWEELRVDGIESAQAADLAQVLGHALPWQPLLGHPLLQQPLPGQLLPQRKPSRYFDLARARDQAGGDILALLGPSTRRTVRRNLRAYEGLTCTWVDNVTAVHQAFDDLVRLHQARWNAAGKPGAYASRRFHAFHRELVERLVPLNKLAIMRVARGDDVIGCLQLLLDGKKVLYYQSGFAPFAGSCSPGLVVTYLALQECLRRGFDAYDFLAGDTRYKQQMSTDANQLCWLALRRCSWKFTLVGTLRRVARLLKQA